MPSQGKSSLQYVGIPCTPTNASQLPNMWPGLPPLPLTPITIIQTSPKLGFERIPLSKSRRLAIWPHYMPNLVQLSILFHARASWYFLNCNWKAQKSRIAIDFYTKLIVSQLWNSYRSVHRKFSVKIPTECLKDFLPLLPILVAKNGKLVRENHLIPGVWGNQIRGKKNRALCFHSQSIL